MKSGTGEIKVSIYFAGKVSRDGFWTKGLGKTMFWEWRLPVDDQFLEFMKGTDWDDKYSYHWSVAKDFTNTNKGVMDDTKIRPDASDF